MLLKRSESSTSLIGTSSFALRRHFTSLEVEEEPAVAEVEVGVVSVLVHQLEKLRVQDLCTEGIRGDPGERNNETGCGGDSVEKRGNV